MWAFVEDDLGEEPEEVITFKRVMLHADQVPDNKRTAFSHDELKANDHRGKRWPYDFKAELQALTLVERLEVMRQTIEREVDHDARLEEDRAAVEDERAEIRTAISQLPKDE